MVERLRAQGIRDERVLAAMQAVPRHAFVDEGLAFSAYDDTPLPIGFQQTISQPFAKAPPPGSKPNSGGREQAHCNQALLVL